MTGKMADAAFLDDLAPLLRPGIEYDAAGAWEHVREQLIARLTGVNYSCR
jgi:hypothetical protein